MDDLTDGVEARIRELGRIRSNTGVSHEIESLTALLEDPQQRSSAERGLPRWRYRALARSHRILAGGIIVLAGLGVAVPAAALTSWLARTGDFGDPATSTEVDDSEWIDLGASDAPQVVREAYPNYLTLPDGIQREAVIGEVSRIFERLNADSEGQSRAQEGLMTQTYEHIAICAWAGEWLDGYANDDAPREARATAWLNDPDNYREFVSGGGAVDAMLRFATAAKNGDVKPLEQLHQTSTCQEMMERVKP